MVEGEQDPGVPEAVPLIHLYSKVALGGSLTSRTSLSVD